MSIDRVGSKEKLMTRLIESINTVSPTRTRDDFPEVLSKMHDTVTISPLGRKLGEYYRIAKKEDNIVAIEGIRDTALHLVSSSVGHNSTKFIDSMDGLLRDSVEGLMTFFERVRAINVANLSMKGWFNTFIELNDIEVQHRYLSSTDRILKMGEGVKQTFDDFVGKISDSIIFERGRRPNL